MPLPSLEPGYGFEVDGAIKRLRVDAEVDKIQLLVAYRSAYIDAILRNTRWDGGAGVEYLLHPIDLAKIETALMDVGAIDPETKYLRSLTSIGQEWRERMIHTYRNAVPHPVTEATSMWNEVMFRLSLT